MVAYTINGLFQFPPLMNPNKLATGIIIFLTKFSSYYLRPLNFIYKLYLACLCLTQIIFNSILHSYGQKTALGDALYFTTNCIYSYNE